MGTYCEFGPPLHPPLVCRTASYYEELEKWKLVTKLASLQSSSSVFGSKAAHEKSDLSAAEHQRGRTGTQGREVEECDRGDTSETRGSSDVHIECTRALTFENTTTCQAICLA